MPCAVGDGRRIIGSVNRGHQPDGRAVPLAEVARRLGVSVTDDVRRAARRLPLRFPRSYVDQLQRAGALDLLARIGWPDPEETVPDPGGLDDPVGEAGRAPHPLVRRKYPDRVILLAASRCHFYCRFCFRAGVDIEPSPEELARAVGTIARLARDGVREVILSGGDPLTLDDHRLGALLADLGRVEGIATVRIHTRAPVHQPERVSESLVETLTGSARRPPWVVIHVSHPAELHPAFDEAVARLRGHGIPLLSQTVLLAGVNDAPERLAALFGGLYERGVKPYYLHHPDRVSGTARFHVAIERGRGIVRALRALLPGPAMPSYVVDLPDGSGKVPVDWLEPDGTGHWRVGLPGGKVLRYEERPATGRSAEPPP